MRPEAACPRGVAHLVRLVFVALGLVGAGHRAARAQESAPTAVSFNREVRPILSEHCFACHGPDEKARKAGLRLDLEAEARRVLKSGKSAIVPGKSEESELWHRIRSTSADDLMPPPEMKKPLSDAKREVLRRWIDAGAAFEGHWAYVPPRRPGLPEVRRADWVRGDLDRFVLQRLEQDGLEPTAEAPREKWLRRVSLDLTGLPPTVEDLEGFLADPTSGAHEKVVDRLLASPHYGERMAQQWLDLARYGETQGYHHDRHRDLWRWRDWVIQAFNRNQPFDQFTIEQLAGDLLPQPTRDQLVATGFHRNEMTTSEGGALPEEYIVKYAVGRVDTTARVWLGTSMACAECHDHKYDPISTRDFYRFFAFFYDTPEHGLDREELNPVPRITLETPEQRARAAQLDRDVAALETSVQILTETPRPAWDDAQSDWAARLRRDALDGWFALEPKMARTSTAGLAIRDGGLVRVETTTSSNSVYELEFETPVRGISGLRLEPVVTEEGLGPGTGPGGGFRLAQLEGEAASLRPEAETWSGIAPKAGPWFTVGPFSAASVKEAFEKEFGPEKNQDPAATFGDGSWVWRDSGLVSDEISLRPELGVTYLARSVSAAEAAFLEVRIRTQGAYRVWWNGQSIHSRTRGAAEGAPMDRVRLALRVGTNRLLIKAVHEGPGAMLAVGFGDRPATEATLVFAQAAVPVADGSTPVRQAIDGNADTSWSPNPTNSASWTASFALRDPVGFRGGTRIRLRLAFDGRQGDARLRQFRVLATGGEALAEYLAEPEPVRAALTVPASERTDGMRAELRKRYRRRYVPEVSSAESLLQTRRQERDAERQSWPTAMVMQSATPMRETQIRIRGQYNQLGDRVEAGVPEAILTWDNGLPRNRLGLAKWLVDPRNPLTARVVVNHYWQRLFGTGLVKTSEEFGAQGEWPSHPELLDWLATEFVRSGWDVKAFHRMLVLSSTYRQDSVVSPARLEKDPENRLFTRGPRFRLEAETLRDVAMSVSGLLNPRLGGPSVFPYQPPGLWGQVSFEGTRDYAQSEGSENYRRGLYTYWRRSIPYASFTIFDAPSREVCTVRRPRTNTPLQALALMNDPVYVEAARALAHRILLRGGATVGDRLAFAFRVVLGRTPSEREKALLSAACEREMKRFATDRAAANQLIHVGASRPPVDVDIAELAAWTMIANTLLNLDETVTKG